MKRLLLALCLSGFASAQTTFPLPGQAAQYPLTTRITPVEAQAFARVLDVGLGKVEVQRLPGWRTKLAARAKANDPLAQFMYARTYDLFTTGQGTPQDARVAMQWYTKAADQKFASVELFLFNVYEYSLLGQPKNPKLAARYLQRAYQHSGGSVRAEAALELARQTNPEREDPRLPGFQASAKQTRAYLEEILKLEPKDTTALDWLMGIYLDSHDYSRALEMARRTDNSAMWVQMALVLADDHPGFPAQPKLAATFLKRRLAAVKNDKGEAESTLYLLMQLECEKKISRADYQNVFDPAVYQRYLTWRVGCRV
ncbi:tetratricopeptide repeat protein [Deinococcus sp. PESE-13]